jgi:hypothetical protein
MMLAGGHGEIARFLNLHHVGGGQKLSALFEREAVVEESISGSL